MSTQTQSPIRFLYLDSIRALAAIYVVLHHASLQYYQFGDTDLSGIKKLIIKFFSYGHLSVDLFIVLSGFSLMIAVIKNGYTLKGGSILFFKRRVLRIVPPYFAAVSICLLLIWLVIGDKTGTLWDMTIPITYNDIFSHLLMVHDIFSSTGSHINYSLWSISVEFRIYFLFPVLILIWRKVGAFSTLVFSIFFAIIGTVLLIYTRRYYPDISLTSSGVCPYIILFTLGMLAADISLSQSKIANNIKGFYSNLSVKSLLIFLIIYIVAYQTVSILLKTGSALTPNQFFISQEVKDVFIGIFSTFFLIICAVSTRKNKNTFWIVRFLSWKPLVFIGTFSYSLYLIHPPILQLLSKYIVVPMNLSIYTNTCLLIAVGTPISIFISYLFFLLFERPFLNSGKKESILTTEINAVINPPP